MRIEKKMRNLQSNTSEATFIGSENKAETGLDYIH